MKTSSSIVTSVSWVIVNPLELMSINVPYQGFLITTQFSIDNGLTLDERDSYF